MRVSVLYSILLTPLLVFGNIVKFDNGVNSQICSGMYAKSDWGGSKKPLIDITLTQFGNEKYNPKSDNGAEEHEEDISVSYIIFEYKDIGNIGIDIGDGQQQYICDDYAIETLGICEASHKGNFLLNTNITNTTILTSKLVHFGDAKINYAINTTGYYCVSTFSQYDKEYKGKINFQNAFGELSASEIPKLPAYGILTLCYAITLALFGFQFFKKRKQNQILPLQRYLLAMLGFLTFDTIVVWSYYDLVNRTANPSNAFVIFYMIFLSLLNAGKITFSFFLLLCIALGYGVVVLKLDKKVMLKCKILAGCHFLASTLYLITTYYNGSSNSLTVTTNIDDNIGNGFLGLLPLIPVTITLATYYVTILASIRATTANLHKQRQVIKLQLYENLFRIIFFSVILTFIGLIGSSLIYLSMSTIEMIEQHWKGAFFIFEFWPSVVFFFVFMGVAWLWRPTETSYMLAISQQLSGGDDEEGQNPNGHEFELDDLSLMSHSDDEQGARRDSFELSEDIPQNPFVSKKDPPPGYDELDNENGSTGENGNTLFELGDDEETDILNQNHEQNGNEQDHDDVDLDNDEDEDDNFTAHEDDRLT
ncbi:lung seven transmembrane receptor-domain-containing protein [Scheffersomyces amazonensis]|uniref:lung seven transmembrane receptor-domain-containing protein n=1 Tax=Scheffersomyces amazonensis TaxID=1078765 RepID=UPI00315DAACD